MADALRRLSDGLGRLIRDHIALAKAELADDVRNAGKDAAIAAAGLPLLAVGWLLCMVAASLFLGRAITPAGGFLVIGGVHLVAGGVATLLWGGRIAGPDRPDLDRTTAQIREDSKWLKELRRT